MVVKPAFIPEIFCISINSCTEKDAPDVGLSWLDFMVLHTSLGTRANKGPFQNCRQFLESKTHLLERRAVLVQMGFMFRLIDDPIHRDDISNFF